MKSRPAPPRSGSISAARRSRTQARPRAWPTAAYHELRRHRGHRGACLRDPRRRELLRHDDGAGGRSRRHGVGRRAYDRRHDPAGVRDHPRPRGLGGVERVPHGLADRVLVYGDCAVNPKPDVEQLADIAISSAQTGATFGIEPRVAMLSYSTGESGKGKEVEAVRAATELVRETARSRRGGTDPVTPPSTRPWRRRSCRAARSRVGRPCSCFRSRHGQHRLQGRAAVRGRDRHRTGTGLNKPVKNDLSRGLHGH